ncbi:TPA: DUF3168 domain-containing protein [Klebsiella pneumoniae]|uniref:tail completion protein gp17 n=1 Tax=Klebsiella pneumoniae TaxID=573 RepID=UPI00158AEA4C|nr:DUF3168 domain-containing protein [Klebsiella pneumoniae]QQO26028.1 DUF3168 domain-containing protein [Klebsiella michiganensis]MBZ1704000.1 DUF3168 domain-containing protein [Klebsiella pneumoniae]HBQ1255981.1 DUF3168 domain-containing protein [Klebsiella pneumoniae]HBV3371455.1 DUF3168 domain-containing protein [Klebsiella pneumoniae]HCD2380025.1 DUF3168 domain-containing protein [Klebsiella pneumoniae]
MTEDNIYPLLSSLADGRVYPYVVPLEKDGSPSVPSPYVIVSFPSDVSGDVFCGPAESTLRIQVDVWAKSGVEARAIRAQALENLMVLSPTEITRIPGYDTTTKLYRATLEITVVA